MEVDPALVVAVQRGEPQAMDTLIRATYTAVYALARHRLADPSDAADTTQEVYLRVVRSVLPFRDASAFGGWLERLTIDTCDSALRGRRDTQARGQSAGRLDFEPDALSSAEAGPELRAENADLSARTARAFTQLPEEAREVVTLRDVQGLSTKEAAEMLGVSEDYLIVRNWGVRSGEFFTDRDVASANKVCVIGHTLVVKLFQTEDPIGSTIRIKNIPFRVAGVLDKKGANMVGQDQDNIILMPYTTVRKRLQGSEFDNVHAIMASARTTLLMALLSLLPVIGSALVWLPVALYFVATGALWKGLGLIAYGVLVIGLVDNLLRPMLVGRETHIPDYVVMIATLGGLAVFGVHGFVLGPTIAAMFVAVWHLYGTTQDAQGGTNLGGVAGPAGPSGESGPQGLAGPAVSQGRSGPAK